MASAKIDEAFSLFDDYNRLDPNSLTYGGLIYPNEYFYSLKLYEWVIKLVPEASTTLLLASRCQHIGRWEISRESYPEGKAGYLRWRADLAKHHAALAGKLLKEAGYSDPEIEDVQRIVLKQKLRTDEEVQMMENALCLVFLQYQFEDFLAKHDDDDKMIRILRKTWDKMSEPGRREALSLPFSGRTLSLVQRAVAG